MTSSVYIFGPAGVGKSTFTSELVAGGTFGPLQDLCTRPNARGSKVVLRGHQLALGGTTGMYLGVQRDSFPGSDGLDRASTMTATAWLGEPGLPSFILGEGLTLSTQGFLGALQDRTDLLLVSLVAPDEVIRQRLEQRGAGQPESFLKASVTRARNTHARMVARGARVLTVDASEPCELALDICRWKLISRNH